jgi:hypothetical protein
MDNNFCHDMCKNNRRIDITISDDDVIEIKSNFKQ